MPWHNVTKRNPCPICHKPDWCSVTDDGQMCVCRRVQSTRPTKSGTGWIHILRERPKTPSWTPPVRTRPTAPVFDAERAMAGFRAEYEAEGNPDGDLFGSLLHIAADLGIPACHVDRLAPGRSAWNGAWAFPMRDGDGRVVGIRLRQFGSSRKWSVSGSRDGLFYDVDLQPAEIVSNGVRGRELVFVEGTSDVAAAYSLGLPAVGRSSCLTGVEASRALCRRLHATRVTVIGDNDRYKARPDGSTFRPGLDGAEQFARRLGLVYRVVTPPCNDLRDWLRQGLTHRAFDAIASFKKWRLPTARA